MTHKCHDNHHDHFGFSEADAAKSLPGQQIEITDTACPGWRLEKHLHPAPIHDTKVVIA